MSRASTIRKLDIPAKPPTWEIAAANERERAVTLLIEAVALTEYKWPIVDHLTELAKDASADGDDGIYYAAQALSRRILDTYHRIDFDRRPVRVGGVEV